MFAENGNILLGDKAAHGPGVPEGGADHCRVRCGRSIGFFLIHVSVHGTTARHKPEPCRGSSVSQTSRPANATSEEKRSKKYIGRISKMNEAVTTEASAATSRNNNKLLSSTRANRSDSGGDETASSSDKSSSDDDGMVPSSPPTTTVTKNSPSTTTNSDDYWFEPPPVVRAPAGAQHGKGGVFYGGNWVDLEDCAETFAACADCPSHSATATTTTTTTPCPRSQSRNAHHNVDEYDVAIVGAGCLGAAIARELSRRQLRILWLEAADDVSQGATKGNSGIVHAGYDDKPGTNRAKYCWKGNQMFARLDRELRFGYQKNGSLVVAFTPQEMEHLEVLMKRGETNGVKYLRIIDQKELRSMEPHISPDALGALYASEAGNVIPYEYAIALAENAVDNGVELRIRREVQAIKPVDNDSRWELTVRHWEPEDYVKSLNSSQPATAPAILLTIVGVALFSTLVSDRLDDTVKMGLATLLLIAFGGSSWKLLGPYLSLPTKQSLRDIPKLVQLAGRAVGMGGSPVQLADMLVGGSGSSRIQQGVTVETETIRAKYVINCAGGASDEIARMIGDSSFKIKPRIGDYILLNRNQGHLSKHTLFPCPDPKLGKGVLVQTTLWSNLILGPTARDMHDEASNGMSPREIQEYILSKCKKLVPSFNAKETIHTFCGARAKSDRGDWIIEPSIVNGRMIHVAGIDSPGLAGSPAIAVEVMRILEESGLVSKPNKKFNPHRAPIITPKNGMKGLKFGPVGKNDSDGTDEAKMAANVICKCERVTELEVVRALRRSLPIDSTQAIRKRTRAGMGHCQGDPDNYNCEARVKAIIARETGATSLDQIGGRPWPATSILSQRWIGEEEKNELAGCSCAQ